jgi:hypothetical protein
MKSHYISASRNNSDNANNVALTLFMLVTDRDCVLADFTIRKYRTLWCLTRSFRLRVYANCLSTENKKRYFPQWTKLSYLDLTDNEASGRVSRRKGEHFTTPEGVVLRYEGNCEHCDEVWTREHRKCRTPFFGTVDADFEILKPDFILAMLDRLSRDDSLVGISTDYSPTVESQFDAYSGRTLTLNERWHTWCCIYKQSVAEYLDEVSSFYFEKPLPSGKVHAFDSYSHFQHLLTHKYGLRLESLESSYQRHFIHYGAFAKNKSIGLLNIHAYRWLSIASKTGLVSLPGRGGTVLNRVVCRLARYAVDRLFASAVSERTSYDYASGANALS